jgi:hypothetical protein
VSLYPAVFLGNLPLKMEFSSMFQSNLDLPLNTKSVHNYITELLVKFGNFWDSGVELGIFVHNHQNMTLVPNSSNRDNIIF